MAGKVELNYQVNIHEGVNNLEKSVQQIDQSLKNLKFSNNFSKDAKSQVDDLTQKIKKYKELLEKPVKTESDFSKIKQEGNEIIRLYEKLNTQSKKIGNQSAKSIFSNKYGESFNKATAALKQFDSQIAKHNKELKEQQQLQEQSTKELEKFKNKYGTGSTQEEQKKYLSYQKGAITRKENAIKRGMEEGTITKKAGNEQLSALKNQKASLSSTDAAKKYQELNQVVIQTTQSLERLKKGQINIASDKALASAVNEITTSMQQLGLNVPKIETFSDLEKLKETISSFPVEKQREIEQQLKTFAQSAETASGGSARLKEQLAFAQQEIDNMAARAKNLDMLRSRLEYVFGITGMINIFRRAIRSTYNTIKELDEVMTETAVVTNYTVGDMWNKIDEYADTASKLGVSIKGVYEVTTLLYQMGMNTSQAMGAGTEILKMARIAGLDYASAVDAMISALKGFNMEVNAINTKKINDIYSRIAAISASNVEELSTAMSKTASIAANAGMEVESTTALLAQGIEKTREPAETIGTALKTVIARFNELKKAPSEIQEVDGEVVDANKIETALRTAGIALRDTNGEIRNTDEVLFELSSKWNTLDKNTRAYIATMAAGSRQQSRFIAMVSDYARLSQLEEEAINSAGASEKQFEKTLESMNSKVTNLQNQVDTFLTQIMDSGFLKFLIDAGKYLTEFANKLTSLPGILGSISKVGLGIGIFKGGAKLVDTIFRSFAQNGKQFNGLGARIGGNIFMGIKSVFHKGKVGLQNIFGKMIDYDAVIAKNTVGMNAYSKSVAELNARLKAGSITQEFYEQQLRESATTNSIAATSSQAYNSVIAQGLAIKGSDLILQDQELASDTLEILSTEGLTQAKKKEMIQELINQKLRKQGLVLEKQGFFFKMKNYLALMLGNQAARAGAIANLGYASATDAATRATNLFSKAIYKIPFLGWILAVIAALVTLITIIVKCTRTTQQSIDNADKAAERATSRMQELSNEIEGLADTFSKIQELGDSFDDLTKGSVEWTSKLIENNQYLEDLVDKYEVLQGYLAYDENGVAYFKEGYENALAIDLQKQYEKQKTSKIANEYEAARLRYQKGEIDYQDYLSAQSAYVSQGIRSKASDDASIAAANLTSITFGNEYEKIWDEQEEILKDLAKEGSGLTTYNNDTLKKIGQDLGLWYLKDGDIYNDKDFQEELDLNEDDMAERIISSNTLTAIQKNTKDTADSLKKEDTYIQKLAAGKWENITAKDIKDHGKTNVQEAKDQLEKQLADNKGYYIPSSSKYSQIPETLLSDDYVKDLYWKFGEYFYNEGVLKTDDANWDKYTGHGFGVFSSPITMTADDGTDYTFSELFDMSKTAGGWNFDDKALVKQAAKFYQNASNEYTEMIDWGSQLGYTNLDALISTWSTLTDEEKANAAKLDFNSLVLDYSKIFGEGITNGLVNYFETSGNGKDSDFAKVLAMYANSGLKNLEEAFKGLDTTTKVSADEILDFIQVQQQLGNDTAILTDNFLKLTEGMTISADKLQEVVKGINKASRITEGKTGYDTYSKEEIDALKDAGAISSDDILRVGEDQYKVINKTAEEITRYLGIWNSKIIGIDSKNGKSLDFVKLLSSGEYDGKKAIETFGNTGASYLNFGGEGGKSIYEIAKSISENGFVEVVTEEIDNEAIAKLESAKIMWMASGQFDLAKQAEQKINELKNPPLQTGQMSFTDAKEAYKAYLYQQQVITQGIVDPKAKDKLWKQISAQVDQEFTTPEAIQQALNGFISDNYYENTDDYLKEQQEEFLLDVGESGYRNDAARDAMYGNKDEIETARKAAEAVINERNLGGAVNMVAASVNKLNPALGHSADFVKELTIAISDAQKDFEGFKTIIEEVEEDLKSSDPLQYQTAIGKIAQGLRNIGLEVDENWVGKNIKDIMDFYNGSASAANRLYQSLLNLKTASVDWGAMGLTETEFLGIMSGLSFTAEGIGIFTDKAQQNLIKLLKDGEIAASDLTNLFTSIGLDLEYKYDTNGKVTGLGVVNRFLAGANYFRAEHKKNKSSSKWENSYDWLYNLTQKINEELRIREKLENRYNRLLKKRQTNINDLTEARKEELQSLRNELGLQTEMYEKRRGELKSLLRDNASLTKYATYDFENNMVQIDWGRINKVTNETTGEKIEKFIDKLESAEDEMDSAFDAIEDIYDTVQDIYDESRQSYLDFEDRVLEAVVKQYQLEIDRLTQIDSSINDSNSKLLDSIQKSIDAQRQARQNAETEETLNDKLNQLMYKRQDATSSLTELKTLEKELEDSRRDYIDTLVDQKLNELQEQNDEAAEQRQRQIELMEGQLELAQKQGLLWDDVETLINEGKLSTGDIDLNSKMAQLLKYLGNYDSLSEEGQKNFIEELTQDFSQAMEFLNIKDEVGDDLSKIETKLQTIDDNVKKISSKDFTITVNVDKSGGTYSPPTTPKPDLYTDTDVWGNKKYGTYGDTVTIRQLINAADNMKHEGYGAINLGNGQYVKTLPENAERFIQNTKTLKELKNSDKGKLPGLLDRTKTRYEEFESLYIKTWNPLAKSIWYRYATGGLADFTGPAWLDGTKSHPELVLNPRDTENFIQLKDILSSIMSNNIPTITEGARTANSNFEININVDSISSDYDVDRLVERVKKDIVEDSSYRNPVVLNLLR